MIGVHGMFRIANNLELKVVQGKKVLNLRLADNRNKDNSQFFNATAWEKKAENICNGFKKGHRINICSARLRSKPYKDREGNNREQVWFDIYDFQFVETKGDDGDVGF